MTRGQRAAQIWPILVLCATRRQTLTYDTLGRLIGVPRQGLGQLLEPIQSYCIVSGLHPLSSLVVGDKTGTPGEGFIAAAHVPAAQAHVFNFDWLDEPPPDEKELDAACQDLPSNGRSLEDLMREVENRPSVRRNVPWSRDELLRVLDLYLREGPLSRSSRLVEDLSRELRAMGHGQSYHEGHRSPDAVAMQLARFAAADPRSARSDRGRGGPGLKKLWDEFGGDPSRVQAEVERLRRARTGS
jgi:hypothetical protein